MKTKKTLLKTRYVIELVVEDDRQPEPIERRELIALLKDTELWSENLTIISARIQSSEALPQRRIRIASRFA